MDTDTTPAATPEDNMVDGGTPTAEEARLAQELADEEAGTQSGESADAKAAGTDGAAAGDGEDGSQAEAGAEADDAAATGDDADDAGADAAAASATSPVAQPVAPPTPPMDFDAEYAKNQEAFDTGEKSAEEFQQRVREISKAESGFIARQEIYNERQQTAAQQAQAEFVAEAAAWEAQHKDFMANPLFAKVMQDAINAVEAKTPGLPPRELMAQAGKAAFEFTRYTPPADAAAATTGADADAARRTAIANAKAGRKTPAAPATLGGAPTGAHVDTPTGSAFANLDALGIDELENNVSRMSPEQLDAYLRDAPGAKVTGQ